MKDSPHSKARPEPRLTPHSSPAAAHFAQDSKPRFAPDSHFTLQNPLDMHCHLREGEILEAVLGYTAGSFSGAVAMPNLAKPLFFAKDALDYGAAISRLARAQNLAFAPILTLYLSENLDKTALLAAKKGGIKTALLAAKKGGINILKLYPRGATTNSQSGVAAVLSDKMLQIFALAEELGFILSIHGESGGFCLEREAEFGEVFARVARDFPRLKIIAEHLSDRRSIGLLERFDNLFATLTLHHITLCLDDVLGGGLNPHAFCKPMLKTPKDRDALLNLALEAHGKVCFGSDSAPHLEAAKLAGAAGIFSAPNLLGRLCELFEENGRLENLQRFVSDNAAKIYGVAFAGEDSGESGVEFWGESFGKSGARGESGGGFGGGGESRGGKNSGESKKITLPKKAVNLVRESTKIPEIIHTKSGRIVPLFAGREVAWREAGVE